MPEYARFASSIPLLELIKLHKSGNPVGICSVCSSSRAVLKAAIQLYRESDSPLLIESTCNQVNQEGGYTGMTPRDFAAYVRDLAGEADFPVDRIILGGDHLGPNPWKKESAEAALQKAEELVYDCVAAGYSKIHLDASMPCGDDADLSPREIAERSARLAVKAEEASRANPGQNPPVYVIGTEVPAPGGLTAGHDQAVHVSLVGDVDQTIDLHYEMFEECGLKGSLKRIAAVVVSPGVEFGNSEIFPYERSRTKGLRDFIEARPGMIFEAHSTDYQSSQLLRQMVEDHFAILKVGPALTFAYREAIFRLAAIEEEIPTLKDGERSHLVAGILKTMREEPGSWREHYSGSEEQIAYSMKYSLSDRIRYYWGFPAIRKALNMLMRNLRENLVPPALLSQYFPDMFSMVYMESIDPDPDALIGAAIMRVLKDYQAACSV